jgi:membrane protease YdiL (CAAX protease family)
MPDAANIGILQDLTCIAGLALFLGLIGYRWLRLVRPHAAWNHDGLVISRPYTDVDLVVMTASLALLLSSVMKPVEQAAGSDPRPDAGMIGLAMLVNLMFCALLLIYLHQIRGLNPAELFGFDLIRRGRRVLRAVLLFYVPMLVIVSLVAQWMSGWLQNIAPGPPEQELVRVFQTAEGTGLRVMIVLAAVVIAPLAEEIMFRGFVYGVLKRYTDAPFAAILSGLFFAIIHMHIGSLVPLWVLAVIFCIAYEITGCLLVPMLLHAAFNGTSIVVMLLGAGQ